MNYEIPENWVWTSIDDLYDIIGGGTPSTSVDEYWKGDIPWISSADIYSLKDIQPRRKITKKAIENSATNLVPEKSIIVVTRVGLGKVAITSYPLCFSQDSQALVANHNFIDPVYAVYYLSQAVQRFKRQHQGTTIAGVTKKQVKEIPFPLPPLGEQRRIVSHIEQFFTQLDEGVRYLQQTQTRLEQYKQATLKSAFQGKITQNNQYHREERTRLPLEELTDAPFPIKATWHWHTLGQLSSIKVGTTPSRFENRYWNGKIPWISSGLVRFSHINSVKEYVSEQALSETSLKLLPIGTVLLAMIGEGKTRGQAAILDIEATINQNIAAIICSGTSVIPEYLFYWLLYRYEETRGRGMGGMQPALNTLRVKQIPIPIPPKPEQLDIVNALSQQLSIIDALREEIEKSIIFSQILRERILKMAFEGKLVQHDPTEEPASVLLERIKESKRQMKLQYSQRRLV